MSQNDPILSAMKKFKVSLNLWLYGKLEMFAKENGMSVMAAVRYIINQFFKTRP